MSSGTAAVVIENVAQTHRLIDGITDHPTNTASGSNEDEDDDKCVFFLGSRKFTARASVRGFFIHFGKLGTIVCGVVRQRQKRCSIGPIVNFKGASYLICKYYYFLFGKIYLTILNNIKYKQKQIIILQIKNRAQVSICG